MTHQDWFTAAELAALSLPDVPVSERGVQKLAERRNWADPAQEGQWWRKRRARGGGIEFHYAVLPNVAQVKLALMRKADIDAEQTQAKAEVSRADIWRWFEQQTDKKKNEAKRRLEALQAVETLVIGGASKVLAMQQVAVHFKVALSGLYRWEKCIHGRERHDRLAYLAPQHTGATTVQTAECPDEGWRALKRDYLRPERPNFTDCYRRLQAIAREKGWELPCEKTLFRRIQALPEWLRVMNREGMEALARLFPAQERDRTGLHALEAVNADGHKWDVFVKWPDGTIGRPMMVAFQDLYSNKFLSWRVDKTENQDAVRLAFGDLVEAFGVPSICLLDNGRAFANKWLTGGMETRFRFKIKEDDPMGIMKMMGMEVHWATPYHGQAKPIERGFKDFAQGQAKHPKFAGAWTGNCVDAKPENYASTAVPLDVFIATVAEGIHEHNARAGRRTRVCGGRSFDEAFAESYAKSPIRKATEEQQRLWLMAADGLTVRKQDATLHIAGNRYWSEFLTDLRGQKVTVRFDPEFLHQPLHVYRLDGAYLGAAECLEAAGFFDMAQAKEHARKRKRQLRAWKELDAIENSMNIEQVAAMMPAAAEPAPAPETKVVRPLFGAGNTALKAVPMAIEEEISENELHFGAAVARQKYGGLRLVIEEEEDE